MAMVINTNVASLNAQRNLSNTQNTLNTSLQRLSSGLRINSAKDDAAGLAITNRMSSQIRGLNQAVRNANDGISVAQTAEGALSEVTSILQRMRELAVQSANDSNTADDRASIQLEVDELVAELDRIAETTSFNNRKILDGTAGKFNFQVGANANETIQVEMVNVKTNSLGSQAGIVQSQSMRITLSADGAEDGTIGASEVGVATTDVDTSIAAGDVTVAVGSKTAVDIADASFGGAMNIDTTTDLKDVESSNYGSGLAKDIAARINKIREDQIENTNAGESGTYLEGVYASAKTTFKISDLSATETDEFATATESSIGTDFTYVGAGTLNNGDLEINGVDIGPVNVQEKDANGALTTAINAKSDITGVTASINSDGELLLTAEDGRDIVFSTSDATATNILFAAGSAGNGQATTQDFEAAITDMRVTGNVTVTAQDTLTFAGDFAAADFGFQAAQLEEDNVQAVGTIANADVSTVDGANTLIGSVDSALRQVDDMRAKLGAVQNRLESTIANLESVSENVSASRSRTLDADFAAETASMTKAQILQQAGVAMLAQANQLPQAALSLLQ
jgi:flagellin